MHIGAAVGIEMLGYGFGFVGMILFIMQAVAPGKFQTAHYALGSGVMQLGFIFQDLLGRRAGPALATSTSSCGR